MTKKSFIYHSQPVRRANQSELFANDLRMPVFTNVRTPDICEWVATVCETIATVCETIATEFEDNVKMVCEDNCDCM